MTWAAFTLLDHGWMVIAVLGAIVAVIAVTVLIRIHRK